jgi:hypothetical protein
MQKIIYVLLMVAGMMACQSSTKNLGEQFQVKNPISVEQLMTDLKSTNTIKDVQIEGKIGKSCMSEGCWFTINDASGKEIFFDIKDKKFRVPTNSPGKIVVVLADAQLVAADSINNKPEKTELLVKGLLFK